MDLEKAVGALLIVIVFVLVMIWFMRKVKREHDAIYKGNLNFTEGGKISVSIRSIVTSPKVHELVKDARAIQSINEEYMSYCTICGAEKEKELSGQYNATTGAQVMEDVCPNACAHGIHVNPGFTGKVGRFGRRAFLCSRCGNIPQWAE